MEGLGAISDQRQDIIDSCACFFTHIYIRSAAANDTARHEAALQIQRVARGHLGRSRATTVRYNKVSILLLLLLSPL